ncbi:MAG: sugar ABC transporter permease, partial [Clostridia bacterium]|nr:sugar ABC transporter permease [Clostridia bacterium]
FKGRGVVRAVSLIPWVTPGVLIALMRRWMYDGNYGVINDLLMRLGLIKENIAFLSKPGTAMASVIVTIVWQGIPFFALMLLAGLQGISYDLYEAASIDGATGWQKLIYVTIPSLRNTIFVTTMLRIIWVANSVDVIFNMTEGGPAYATQTLSVYIYKKASALDMGYASAMAIMLMLVLLLAAIPYLRNTFRDQEG